MGAPDAAEAERDRSILERLLEPIVPGKAAAIAAMLIERHRFLFRILRACEVSHRSDPVTRHLRLVQQALHASAHGKLATGPVLSTSAAATEYLMVSMGDLLAEQVRTLYLDVKNHLIADEVVSIGTIDTASVFPREIIRRALELGATGLILAHNHPSGDPKPSEEDAAATRRLIEAGRELDIRVQDHLVVSRAGWISLRSAGLLA